MSDREAFEHWYAGHTGDPHIRNYCDSIGRYQFNSMQSAWQAWQAAQAQAGDGEAVAEIQEYQHWLYCDAGELRSFEWRKRQVNNCDLLNLPHGTKLYTRPQPAQQVNQQLLEALQEMLTSLQAVRELELATHTKSGATPRQQRAAWMPVNDATTKARAAIAAAQEGK